MLSPKRRKKRMSTKAKVVLTAIVLAAIGFMLNPETPLGAAVFGHPPEDGGPAPTSVQIALLMGVGLVQAVGFGLGGAFLLFGRGITLSLVRHRLYANLVWISTVWLLMSWVPHSAMHQVAGFDFSKLILIEYVFHVTLVAAAAVYAAAIVKGERIRTAEARAARATAGAPL
jgi:hypothetical protein